MVIKQLCGYHQSIPFCKAYEDKDYFSLVLQPIADNGDLICIHGPLECPCRVFSSRQFGNSKYERRTRTSVRLFGRQCGFFYL
jgi:hypothetical protein